MLQTEVVKYDCRWKINILASLSVTYVIILKTKLFSDLYLVEFLDTSAKPLFSYM